MQPMEVSSSMDGVQLAEWSSFEGYTPIQYAENIVLNVSLHELIGFMQ
jgi:hypothetical protein